MYVLLEEPNILIRVPSLRRSVSLSGHANPVEFKTLDLALLQ